MTEILWGQDLRSFVDGTGTFTNAIRDDWSFVSTPSPYLQGPTVCWGRTPQQVYIHDCSC